MIELVSTSWLARELANGFGLERDQTVLEVGCGPPDRSERIPRATWLDTNEIERAERCWKLIEDPALLAVLARHGITAETTAVVAGEPLIAARVAWALSYAGVRSVRIVDGGSDRWIRERRPMEARPLVPALHRERSFGAPAPLRKQLHATRDDVRAIIESRRAILGDVRSRAEHDGHTSGYSYIRAKGRIPNSTFARGGPNPGYLEDYTRDDGSFEDPDRVQAMWRELGIEGRVCFYCGTGWRASVAFLFAQWLGLEASVYDGGWYDWCWSHASGVGLAGA